MTRELFFEIINRKLLFDAVFIIVSYGFYWFSLLRLGLWILKVRTRIKEIIPAVVIMMVFSICRPFFPRALFGIALAMLAAFWLTFYTGKFSVANILKSIWTSFIIILISGMGNLVALSICLLNSNISDLLVKTTLGIAVGTMFESSFPALALFTFPRFTKQISLVPPIEKIDRFDVIGLLTFGSLYYIVYFAIINLFFSYKSNLQNKFSDLIFLWVAGIAALSGHHSVVRNLKKKNQLQRQQHETERLLYEERIAQLEGQNQELAVLNEQLSAHKIEPQEAITTMQEMIKKLQDATTSAMNQQKNYIVSDINGEPVQFRLTPREKDVLRLIAREGKSNKEIADVLNLKEGWVKNIVSRLLIKTKSADRTQLAILALTTNLIDDNDLKINQ